MFSPTTAIAVAALGLSVYNTIQARWDKRPKLNVEVTFGFLTYGTNLSNQKIIFRIGNPWTDKITLVSLSIPLPDKKSLAFFNPEGERKIPVELAPGTATRFWIDADELEAQIIKAGIPRYGKFRVQAEDAIGNKYLSAAASFGPK